MKACWNPPTQITDIFKQLNDRKGLAEERNEIINDSQLLCLCCDNVHATIIFNETLKTRRKKTDIDKTYANFPPFMTQQEEDCLSYQPTYGTTG